MKTNIFAARAPTRREGDLYKSINLHGATFDIRYGYYAEIDRAGEPVQIYPDFLKTPVYTHDGCPFVTLMQDTCSFYTPWRYSAEPDCSTCKFLERGEELIGVCRCPQKKILEKETP